MPGTGDTAIRPNPSASEAPRCPTSIINSPRGWLSQSWTDISLIDKNDEWSLVASIQGFLGDIDAGSPTGTDPQSVTGEAVGALDVIANQTNPNSLASGGVAEFEIADPTIALNGSGTADAPSLVIYLDASGREDVRLQFNARDLDGSIDNSQQQIAVQYRIGETGAWTNVPAGYISDATQGPLIAGQVTPIDVTLPSSGQQPGPGPGPHPHHQRRGQRRVGRHRRHHRVERSDHQPPPWSRSATPTITEGDSGTQFLTFTVTRSDNTGEFTVDYLTADGSAKDGSDYAGAIGSVGFTAGGALQQTISIAINGDTEVEPDEDFTITLGNVVNTRASASIGDGVATGTIEADDFPLELISNVQGAGELSAFVGQTIVVEAIVVGDFQDGDTDGKRNLGGFYLQEELTELLDGNVLTSEGIFVFGGAGRRAGRRPRAV